MAPGSSKKKGVEVSPVDKITKDILADIISRVPYKSTCCCKCVSTRWRNLFSHPDHRKKLPQPLAGFFYEGYNRDRFPKTARYFTNVSGEGDPLIDPSLSFLPKYESLHILDCCNGLLLCRCRKPTEPRTMDYVVCNPATKKWVVVPASDWSSKVEVARLGFEPAVSSHFHVFEFIDEVAWGMAESERIYYDGTIKAVATYSSKAGVWRHQMVENGQFSIPTYSKGVFFNCIMHLAAFGDMVVTFDVEGNLLWIIGTPASQLSYDDSPVNDVFVSQGQLYFTSNTRSESGRYNLSVQVLEDYSLGKWTLKHTVSHLQLFGRDYPAWKYNVISFHPEHNMIFIVCGKKNTLMSYDMDCRKQCFIRQLGQDCPLKYFSIDEKTPFIPYVPLFTESSADGP
jgi:F-box interacting protein